MERNSTNRPTVKTGISIVVNKDFLSRRSKIKFFHITSLYLAKSLALAMVEVLRYSGVTIARTVSRKDQRYWEKKQELM